jgi:hypothetical protein
MVTPPTPIPSSLNPESDSLWGHGRARKKISTAKNKCAEPVAHSGPVAFSFLKTNYKENPFFTVSRPGFRKATTQFSTVFVNCAANNPTYVTSNL